MKVAIIGAGFTGLSAGYYLSKKGVKVTIFERDSQPGGLAIGFSKIDWEWPLEKHYHHLFTSDYSIKKLAGEVSHPIIFKRPKTSMLVNGKIVQVDSPINLITFPYLSIIDRLRTGATIFFLKTTNFWKPLEKITAKKFLLKTMGTRSWEVLWRPLFEGKFGKYSDRIPAAWFWARIKKRSVKLGYPKGGFESLAKSIAQKINGNIFYQTEVLSINKNKLFEISYRKLSGGKIKIDYFDKVISTLPFPFFLKIYRNYPDQKSLQNLPGIGAVNMVMRLKKSFLPDNTYWLNINEKDFPILAIVEHTNFMPKKYYNNEHLVYIGNYLPATHQYFQMTDNDLLNIYDKYLRTINPEYKKNLIGFDVFKAPFAQPVIPLNYSKIIPEVTSPVTGLYLATIQQVYPWDRGTNYAVELGEKTAKLILNG